MAQMKEIMETEKQRGTLELCRTAHLYREGNFMRAYGWSAWLFVKHVNDFKVTNRVIKALGEAVPMIGFPPASMEKFTPQDAQVNLHQDGSMSVVLPSEVIPESTDLAALAAEYEEWCKTLPITESKSSKKERESPFDDAPITDTNTNAITKKQPITLTGIIQRILAYPLEQKSPMECMTFLSEIKKQISAII